MERVPDWPIWVLALASAVAASVLGLSTVLQAFSGEQLRLQPGAALLLAPGAFLIRSLGWAAILVPVYLYVVAYAVGRAPADARVPTLHVALPVAALIIPIVASLIHVLTLADPPPLPAALVAALGRPTSVLLLLVLLVTSAAAVVLLSGVAPRLGGPVALLGPPESAHDTREAPPREDESAPEPGDQAAGQDRAGRDDQAGRGDRAGRSDRYDESTILQSREPFAAILAGEPAAADEPPAAPAPPAPPEPAGEDAPRRARPRRSRAGGRETPATNGYHVPIDRLLDEHRNRPDRELHAEAEQHAEVLTETLQEFRISAKVTGISRGPAITMYEILPAAGVKLSSIVNLADNIALQLAASRVRIVAPIPGKHAVGIEVPNRTRAIVGFRTLLEHKDFRSRSNRLPIALGQGISGECQIMDLAQTPHLLIAGATGSGKSVCVNSIICSLVCARTPEELRLLLIDPKIVELKFYNDIPHLLTPVITESKRAFQALQYCLCEMERRYSLLDEVGVRDIASFNRKVDQNKSGEKLPYIVIVIDELADLMATTGKELEATLARLAAMARAVGMHIVLATQRPSIDVITGLIKANIPSRIAFMVASKFDSRIIIDGVGAEKLLGRGDMLFASAWDPAPIRIQGAYLSDEEVEAVADHVRTLGQPDYIDEDVLFEEEELEGPISEGSDDPMMEQALDIVLASGKASASYLQRKLKIGYNRAARLVEEMEARGIVGPAQGSKAREVVHVPSRPD
ncbi:MAG: DNA translocase FtsK [Spirochaetaceae bacterium]|nr:DNA translocase FtsK [Spirochaetaceae bacterium]